MNIRLHIPPICIATCLCLLCGCQSDRVGPHDGPAVLVNPDAAVIAHLHTAVSAALGGRQVTLAPDALTKTDLLIIEPVIHRTIAGRIGSGRTMTRPEKFHLVLQGSRCSLLHDGTRFSAVLPRANCRPVKPRR